MRRHTRIAATAAIALGLLLTPHFALAQNKAGAADKQESATPFENEADEAFRHMLDARDDCNLAVYIAARARLLRAAAEMRRAAKAGKKLSKYSEVDPAKLIRSADRYERYVSHRDEESWYPCPDEELDQSSTPPRGRRVAPPFWVIPLAERQYAAVRDGFDRPATGSTDGLAMVDRALRAARPSMGGSPRSHNAEPEGDLEIERIDPRYPGGFRPGMGSPVGMSSFGGWGF